jgi:hypothetical protein
VRASQRRARQRELVARHIISGNVCNHISGNVCNHIFGNVCSHCG